MTKILLLLSLLLSSHAYAWTAGKGYSDTPVGAAGSMTGGAPTHVILEAGGCNVTTAFPAWDVFATSPVANCVTGTVLKKGVLTFDDSNACTTTTATTGCAQVHFPLPLDFPATGRIDANLFFTNTTSSPDLVSGRTVIWTIATVCTRPLATGANTDNPAAFNTPQSLTSTQGASEAAQSKHVVSQASITTTGCQGGDEIWVRVGRNTTDTVTSGVDFTSLELIIYLSV